MSADDDDVEQVFLFIHVLRIARYVCLLPVYRSVYIFWTTVLNGEVFVFYEPISIKEIREKRSKMCLHSERKKKRNRKCLAAD